MKNKFIIFSLIASVIGYSSTLPVNVEMGLSSGYSKLNISEKELDTFDKIEEEIKEAVSKLIKEGGTTNA